jgi:hypothetical protein
MRHETQYTAVSELNAMTSANGPNPHGPLRVGVGGPVGSGETALMDATQRLRDRYEIAAITSDIHTKWDANTVRSGAPAPSASRPAAARTPPSRGRLRQSRRGRRDARNFGAHRRS